MVPRRQHLGAPAARRPVLRPRRRTAEPAVDRPASGRRAIAQATPAMRFATRDDASSDVMRAESLPR